MKTILAVMAGVLVAQIAFADAASIIKQHAKDLANQNNARQGGTGTAAPGPAPSPPTAPPPAPAESANLTELQSQLGSFKAGDTATAEQKQKLARALMATAETGSKPTAESAGAVASDLASAFSRKPLSAQNRAQVVRELDALLNPSRYPQAKAEGILNQMQSIFLANGLGRDDAKKLAEDVKAMAGKK